MQFMHSCVALDDLRPGITRISASTTSSGRLGVKGSHVQVLSSRRSEALMRGNFCRGFFVSEGRHWLVRSLHLLDPPADGAHRSSSVSSATKRTSRCPLSGPEHAPGDAPAAPGRVGVGHRRGARLSARARQIPPSRPVDGGVEQ